MSANGSWWGGEAEFEYIDEDEEYLRMVVTNKEKWRKMFDKLHEELSKKQSDRQTSNSPGKTGPGKFLFIIIPILHLLLFQNNQ